MLAEIRGRAEMLGACGMALALWISLAAGARGQTYDRSDEAYRPEPPRRYSQNTPSQPPRYAPNRQQRPQYRAPQRAPQQPRYPDTQQVVPVQHKEPVPRYASPGGPPPAQQAARRAAAPQAPFQLSEQEQAYADQILTIWEQESAKVKSYVSNGFERWEYDPVFGPGGDIAKTKSKGQLKYAKPDKGMFKIEHIFVYDEATKDWVPQEDAIGEHWVCDGKAVYEFNARLKQLIVRPLPPELQGKAIADGPLPFLFGAEKKKIKERYFVQVTKTTEEDIWLKAYPKFRRDAANFDFVELILDRQQFLPKALMVYLPGGGDAPLSQRARTLYLFPDAKVNSPLERFMGVFQKPRAPWGWKTVVEEAPVAPQPPNQSRRPLQHPR